MTALVTKLHAPDAHISAAVEIALPAVMSPAQLGKELDVSVRTLERWREAGTGPAFQHPKGTRIYRYFAVDVIAWLRNEETPAATGVQDERN